MNLGRGWWFCVAWLVGSAVLCISIGEAQETKLAATPPMGWNSWNSFAENAKESDLRATAEWMAKSLKSFGWQYIVVDEGWYIANHGPDYKQENAKFSMDEFGRYTPATSSFPSAANGAGFRPLVDYIHSLGLKFGLHILRGIPREAVSKNLAIQGSTFHAVEAANTGDACPWNGYNWGLETSKAAAQAYYDSLGRQFAEWHIDFVKIDCIASRPYKGDEIRMISEALRKSGRPIVLSLSPGAAPLDKADEMAKYAQMWRISDDEWDVWNSDKDFPQGVNNQFERAAQWISHSRPGNWPDADMLAIGRLEPSPGWGEARQSRLTQDEQRTLVTLWSIFRSPLMIGGNLLLCDEWTKSLLTNAEVIAVDQHSKNNHAVDTTSNAAAWVAEPESGGGWHVAVFNRSDEARTIRYTWKQLGLNDREYRMRDLWEHTDLGKADAIEVKLHPHASALFIVQPSSKFKTP